MGFDPVKMNQAQFAAASEKCIFEAAQQSCPNCGSEDCRKLLGFASSYIRGNGYLDKNGAKNDINLSLLTTGNDPYAKYRMPGESNELANKLRKNKEFNSKPSNVYVEKQDK